MIDLRQGDCMELLKTIDDDSIDCIVTSPPYNKKGLVGVKNITENTNWKRCNIDYDVYNDCMEESEYREWQVSFLNECYRVLKPTGSMFYNHKVRRINGRGYFPDWVFLTNFVFYQMAVWDRGGAPDVNSHYLFPSTELIFWLVKDKPKVNKSQAAYQTEVWKIQPTKGELHPATFPYELAKNCIVLSTSEGDTVLDPFMGSGTTGVACVNLNRNFIGFELSSTYMQIAQYKISNGMSVATELPEDNLIGVHKQELW